jgi:ribosomal protein S18 acetylase RimI-like enzyme
MTNISIISVSTQEVSQLQMIARSTFYETFAAMNTPENMRQYLEKDLSIEKLTAELNNPESQTFFAQRDDEIIGYLKLNVGAAQTEKVAPGGLEIQRIYVKKEYQGVSVGADLLNFAIDLSVGQGRNYVWLGVWEKNQRAIRFYEKNGFMPFGSHVFHLGEDAQTDILMRKLLS